jgi:hypothetical protein
MSGKLKEDSWQLRIAAVFMMVFGIGGLLYSIGLLIPLFTGIVGALRISLALYFVHLVLSFGFYLILGRMGFYALTKPQKPMVMIKSLSDGIWLLLYTVVFQLLHLLYEGYLGEGMIVPLVLAAVQIALPVTYLVEKRQIAADLS